MSSAAGVGIQALLNLKGEGQAARDKDEERRILERMMQEWRDVPLPELESLRAEELGTSAMDGVTTDPRLRDDQIAVLDELRRIYQGGGMTLEDDAAMNKMMGQAARQDQAGRQRLEESFAARGQLGSGQQLVMAMGNQQAAAQRANENAMDRAGMAERRAMDAMLQRGRLATDMRNQEFGEKSKKAEAADYINRYNATSRSGVNQYNVGLPQQQFNNRVSRLSRGQAPAGNLAAYHGQNAVDTRQAHAGYGKSAADIYDAWEKERNGK